MEPLTPQYLLQTDLKPFWRVRITGWNFPPEKVILLKLCYSCIESVVACSRVDREGKLFLDTDLDSEKTILLHRPTDQLSLALETGETLVVRRNALVGIDPILFWYQFALVFSDTWSQCKRRIGFRT